MPTLPTTEPSKRGRSMCVRGPREGRGLETGEEKAAGIRSELASERAVVGRELSFFLPLLTFYNLAQ